MEDRKWNDGQLTLTVRQWLSATWQLHQNIHKPYHTMQVSVEKKPP